MIYDVIIVGSGPAGLTAAIYAKRAKLSVLVLEKEFVSGGQVINTNQVDNYPGLCGISGFEMGTRFQEHAESLGVEIVNVQVKHIEQEAKQKVNVIYTEQEEYRAKTLILAMGASHRKLGIPGEEELSGMGVSYCATCDGAFFQNRKVAVAGGGNTAVQEALFLAGGCEKVYLIHRRDSLRAEGILKDMLEQNEKIEVIWNSEITRITGEDHVECIRLKNRLTGEERMLDVDGVFIAAGLEPNTQSVERLFSLKDGYIEADEMGVTSVPGIFAAGDIRTKKLRQIVTAVADGANAAFSAQEYLLSDCKKER